MSLFKRLPQIIHGCEQHTREKRLRYYRTMPVGLRKSRFGVAREKKYRRTSMGQHIGKLEYIRLSQINVEDRNLRHLFRYDGQSCFNRARKTDYLMVRVLKDRLNVQGNQSIVLNNQNCDAIFLCQCFPLPNCLKAITRQLRRERA